MTKQNMVKLAEEVEKKFSRRDKKKKPKMKIVGAGVKQLAKIIKLNPRLQRRGGTTRSAKA